MTPTRLMQDGHFASDSRPAPRRSLGRSWVAFLLVLALFGVTRPVLSQEDSPRVTELKARFYLISNSSGNLVLYVDDSVSLVVGCQEPALVDATRRLVKKLHAPPVRYALLMASDSDRVFGDAHWGDSGAITIAHESLNKSIALRADSLGPRGQPVSSGRKASIGFSEVLQVNLPHAEAHFVHRPAGVTQQDVIVHFEKLSVLMLGNLVAADEYPDLRVANGSSIFGVIKSLNLFIEGFSKDDVEPIIPGRGRPLTLLELLSYREMLEQVVSRVARLIIAGQSENAVVASHPTADFDPQWGHGRVSPDQFVRSVFQVLSRR